MIDYKPAHSYQAPIDHAKCRAAVQEHGSIVWRQCSRKAGHDGYCAVHRAQKEPANDRLE
jgi:hypothetical protein